MTTPASLREAVLRGDLAEADRLAAGDRRSVCTLVGLTYHADAAVRATAAAALARAAGSHPELVTEALRRLIWAMNDESGTNAVTAPAVIRAVAESHPRLLVPLVPDLLRLTGDPGLRDELVAAVRRVAELLPAEAAGAVGAGLGRCGGGQHRGIGR